MLQYDFEDSVGYWIFCTAHRLQQRMNEELGRHGITFRQWEVLVWLAALGGESTQAELAQRMNLEAPTLVGVLERMERDGWVARTMDERDRRRKLIRPTPQVEPAWARMVECARRVRAEAVVDALKWPGETYRGLLADGKLVAIALPMTVVGTVTETAPPMKGGGSGTKDALLDNGVKVRVSLLTAVGDKVRLDPETLEFKERV